MKASDKAERIDAMKIVVRNVNDLKPYKRNARTHSKDQVSSLARSMERFGFTNPVLIGKDLTIIAGHGRLEAAKLLGWERVPTVMLADLTESEKRAYILADNRLALDAGWDDELLKLELGELSREGFDLSLTGFNLDDIDRLTLGPDKIEEVDDVLPGLFQLADYAQFDSDLIYQLPPLREDMLVGIPKMLTSWAGKDATPDDGESFYLWQWRSDSLRGLPRDRFMVGFYVDDYRFDCVYLEARKYVTKMLNIGARLAIMPNYSWSDDEVLALSIYSAYRSRWVARYMQEAGIGIIPDVFLVGTDRAKKLSFAGIPKGCEALSTQVHSIADKKGAKKIESLAAILVEADAELSPKSWLIYGNNDADKIVSLAKLGGKATIVRSRASVRSSNVMGKRGDYAT